MDEANCEVLNRQELIRTIKNLRSTVQELQEELEREKNKLQYPPKGILQGMRTTIDRLQISWNKEKAENEKLNKLMPHVYSTCKHGGVFHCQLVGGSRFS